VVLDIIIMEDTDLRSQSDFNMSISFLNQILMSLALCENYRRYLDLDNLFIELMNLYVQTSTEMKGDSNAITNKYFDSNIWKKEEKKLEKEFKIAEEMIQEIEIIRAKYLNSFRHSHGGANSQASYELFKKLLALEMFFRRILKESGLLLRVKEDARFSMMG
jgi:hypothetical protein